MAHPFVRPHGLRPALSAPELARALGLSEAEAQQVERDVRKSLTQVGMRDTDYGRDVGARTPSQPAIVAESQRGRHARTRRGNSHQQSTRSQAAPSTPRPRKLVAHGRDAGAASRRSTTGSTTRRSGARSR